MWNCACACVCVYLCHRMQLGAGLGTATTTPGTQQQVGWGPEHLSAPAEHKRTDAT